jgi:hypothetical protein
MAKEGNYAWSPRQMERINARRAARGREQLVNLRNPQYQEESEDQPKTQRKPAFPSERPSALDQYKGQKGLRERMAEKGSMKKEMEDENRLRQVGRSVESEVEKMKRKPTMGISTPSLQGSYSRFTA